MTKLQSVRIKLSDTFHFSYFIHAGMLDAITTIIALHIGFSELNPIVDYLFPQYVFAIPSLLLLLAYVRSFSVTLMFKNSKYLKPMMWFTLYFPGLFNIVGLVMYYKEEIIGCCFVLAPFY